MFASTPRFCWIITEQPRLAGFFGQGRGPAIQAVGFFLVASALCDDREAV